MNIRIKVLFVALIIGLGSVVGSSVSAFDGNRQGFALGGGVGVFSFQGRDGRSTSGTFVVSLGYGLDMQNTIILEGFTANPRSVGDFSGGSTTVYDNSYVGVSWYHYMSREKESVLAGLRVGKYSSHWIGDETTSLHGSLGYEYHHVQVIFTGMYLLEQDGYADGLQYGISMRGLAF